MIIKRWRLIIRQYNNDGNLAESETNQLILLQTHLKFRRTVPLRGLFHRFHCFSSAAPHRTVYSEVPSQMAAHIKTGSPL